MLANCILHRISGNEELYKTGVSGTAGVGAVKMVVTQPPCSISEFVAHHTEIGARYVASVAFFTSVFLIKIRLI